MMPTRLDRCLRHLMRWPQATFASKVTVSSEGGQQRSVLTREIDGGLEILEISLPAVISADLRLNKPRYATLANIIKARKKPLETLTPQSLDVDVTPLLRILSVSEPPRRAAGVKVGSVDELVRCLKGGVVIA